VGGATDNTEESCVVFTSRALGLETPLMTTHQIDMLVSLCPYLYKLGMLKCENYVANVNLFHYFAV
jgi:hypothetical protein